MNPKLLDVFDRVGWTFVQALAGSFFAGGVAISQHEWDWKAALTGALTAAAICLFKVLGVNAAVTAKLREQQHDHDVFDYEPPVDDVPPPPAPPAPIAPPPPPPPPAPAPAVDSTGQLPVVDAPPPPPPPPAPPSAGAVSAAGAAEGF